MEKKKIWKWVEHNRFTVGIPLLALVLWIVAAWGCTPVVVNPLDPNQKMTAAELETEFKVWKLEQQGMMIRFDAAKEDIERQQEQWGKLQEALMQLASGSVADFSGLVTLVMGGGFGGLLIDNIRKGGVIGGLKSGKKT